MAVYMLDWSSLSLTGSNSRFHKQIYKFYVILWAGMVGAVSKISALQPEVPRFDAGSAKI